MEAADHGSVLDTDSGRKGAHDEFAGVVRKVINGNQLLLEVRSAFNEGELLELLPFQGETQAFHVSPIFNSLGNLKLEQAKVNTLVRIPFVEGADAGHLIRIKRK